MSLHASYFWDTHPFRSRHHSTSQPIWPSTYHGIRTPIRHHVNPSPSTPHPQNDYSTLSQFERPVWIHLSSFWDISDDSTIVTSTVLTCTVCAVSHNYSYLRKPTLILCQRITSSNGNILIVCCLHLNFPHFSSILCRILQPFWNSSSISSAQSLKFNVCVRETWLTF